MKYEPLKKQCRTCKYGHINMAVWDEWLEERDSRKAEYVHEPVLPYEKKHVWWDKDGPCSDLPFWAMPPHDKHRQWKDVTFVDCTAYEHIESLRWETIE